MTERSEKVRRTRKRNVARRTQWCLRKIRKFEPKTLLEASELLGIPLVHIGEGAFRKSYRIVGTTLLIKFPIQEPCHWKDMGQDKWVTYRLDDHDGKVHTRAEVRKIRKLYAYKSLRAHLPPVYYFNSKDGVMATRYYPTRGRDMDMNLVVTKLIKELTGVTLEDIGGDNVKRDQNCRAIFCDLGY